MKHKDPVNVFNGLKYKKITLDNSTFVSIKAYKSAHNVTKPFNKPISKIV